MAASFGKIDTLLNHGETHDCYVGRESHLTSSGLVTAATVFDLASLSKILATTLLAMKQVEIGKISLDQSLSQSLPEYVAQNPDAKDITLRDLLTHSSGLPAWRPFYEALKDRFGSNLPWIGLDQRIQFFDQELDRVPLENSVGEKIVYSDLGFLLLERVLSPDLNQDVSALWGQVSELKLHYRPVVSDSFSERVRIQNRGESVSMTELCPWRGLLQGQVHDDNCWSRGGIGGHAGVFGTLSDVKHWIRGLFSESIVSLKTLREFSTEFQDGTGNRRALGFDLPPKDGSGSTGNAFSPNTIGHLGFTGTSLWMDLDSGDYAVLLTNRVHPSRDDLRIRQLRRDFHEWIRGK
jgi:hypothetical protein